MGCGVDAARCGQAVEDAGAVRVRLEATEEPEAGVGEGRGSRGPWGRDARMLRSPANPRFSGRERSSCGGEVG